MGSIANRFLRMKLRGRGTKSRKWPSRSHTAQTSLKGLR
jgi:hypothetical protein